MATDVTASDPNSARASAPAPIWQSAHGLPRKAEDPPMREHSPAVNVGAQSPRVLSPSARLRSSAGALLRNPAGLVVALALFATLPVWLSTIHALSNGWVPVGDDGWI